MKKFTIFLLLLVFIMVMLSIKSQAQPSDPGGDPDDTTTVHPVLSPVIANLVRGKDTRDDRRIKRMLAINEPYRVRDHEQRKFERRHISKELKSWSFGIVVMSIIFINATNGTDK